MNFALIGYGRMGRAIERAAQARGHARLCALDEETFPPLIRERRVGEALAGVEVAFEFTRGESAADNLAAVLDAGVSVVCGTTGWEVAQARVAGESGSGPGWIVAPNFSVGVQLFYRVVAAAARLYGNTELYHPYVFETHHRGKRDLPGGTARRLAGLVQEQAATVRRIVEGDPGGALETGALHVTGVRAGFEPGTHTVGFDGEHDVVTLQHRARSRDGFALGAVLAAEWLHGRNGRHEFDEVLDDLLAAAGQRATEGGQK